MRCIARSSSRHCGTYLPFSSNIVVPNSRTSPEINFRFVNRLLENNYITGSMETTKCIGSMFM